MRFFINKIKCDLWGIMRWKRDDVRAFGESALARFDDIQNCVWRLGTIVTGRQRVFHAYFVEIVTPAGETYRGEDRYGIVAALESLADKIAVHGWTLAVAGLASKWSESGLSFNSGYGWWDGYNQPVHMMDPPVWIGHDPDNDMLIESLVRLAVDSMFRPADFAGPNQNSR